MLAARYPDLDPKSREFEYCKEHKAVFITKIGGSHHDGMRAKSEKLRQFYILQKKTMILSYI